MSQLKRPIKQKAYSKMHKLFPIPSEGRYNITLCHSRKFLWFRVAKVGTRTILKYFTEDETSQGSVEQTNFIHYPPALYKDYYKFAFVRNPWDRLISCWQHRVVRSNIFGFTSTEHERMQTLENFVDYVAGLDIADCDRHLRSQSALIDLNNVDYLGRMESFNEDLLQISQQIGLPHKEIIQKNKTPNRKTYHTYYNDTTAEKVADIYKKDLQILGYRF